MMKKNKKNCIKNIKIFIFLLNSTLGWLKLKATLNDEKKYKKLYEKYKNCDDFIRLNLKQKYYR